MPEEKDKIKKLYDTFVSDGYDMESEEDFRKNLLDSTKRKAAYDALVKDGYDMEPFEEFESNIGFGKERTSSQQSGNSASGTVEEPISPANEQTWQPTEKEKVAMLTETDRIMNDVKSHTQTFNERIDNMQEYGINPGLQTKEGKMIFNPGSGKLEKTFLTPAGNRYYSKSLADMESFQYRQAADMSIGGQLRKANLRLQELKAKQEERASEVHKEWAEETENNKAPLAAILGAATYTPRQQSDKENRALSVAIRETEELIKNLEEQKDRENGVDVGFWRGFGRTMGDVRTWDFGMGDMRDAFTMMNADELKKENATEGEREAHDAMMGAIHEKQQAEERYSGNADFWNRAGVMTGYMPSFMLDFVLTGGGFNGLSSFSKESTRLATKVISKETAEKMAQQGFKSYIKENGAKGLGRYATDWTIKALGTTADDLLVRAPLMANTVQAGKTTADIIDRKLGDVVVDENGNYDFSNDKTWGDAIWQSEANAIIENYSEMFGAHLDPVFTLGNMSKLANVVGAKRIGAVLSKADASALNGIMGQTHQMFNKMGMSDYVGEVSEEYYGQLWRTMLNLDDAYQQNPDGTRTNLFASGQFHGDIWGGMALSMGLMGAGKHTLSAANYTSMKHGVNKADAKVNELLGKEVWEPLKATLDLTTNENIGEVAELIAGDKDFTINEKAAVLDYMERSLNLRGFNLASMAQSRGGNRNESVQQANDSYLDGYNIISSQEMNDAKNMYEYQRARVADLVDESMFAMIEENPIAALEFVNGNEQWNDEDKVSVIDYINAKQVYNGMIQRVRDDIDGRIEQSNSMIDARVNRNTGMIQGATMKQDERKVYVISGKLVPYDDGSGVSVTDSDNSIIIRDSETGALEQVSPDAVLSLDESQDPNEQKELAEQAIVEQFAREAADKIDGKVTFNPGDAYTITGQDGSQMQVQVIANEDGIVDNGDGTVNVSDGVNIFPLAKETIQQQADAANLARVAQFEQQRTIENAERKQEMQEAERPQYALNDIVSLTDENGVTVRGNITADADADGKYEVFTEAPINGKRVNLFTRDELDNMLLEHNGVAFERPAENESNNGAENIPENDNNAPQNIPAMQRIPKDEQGNPLYEQADSDTAWDAIVEQTEGDEDMAQTVADGMVADKEEALKKLEKAKSKGGNSIAEKIASEKERKAAIDAAKQDLLAWQKIAGTANRRRMAADAERKRMADEAAALRKAEEEKLRAEREEAERVEREALNGVPDMVDDTPQDARARGYRRVNGHKIDRQEPLQTVQGKEVNVKFSNDVLAPGHVAVIDASLLQPSHIQGVRNPLHFIDEAQPKERNDEASVLSARKIAGNIRPEEITSSITAYTGAPTVNERGEVIQGNNRSDALRLMWESHPEQAEAYRQYLKDHAEEFGLRAEDIAALQSPVLVNMLHVDDATAIPLGQYVAQDTESGGVERIKPKNALQRMGIEVRSFANLLLRASDDEVSFAGLVDANGASVLKWMSQRGFISPTQYKSAFDSKGNLTPESKNDLRGIMYQSIFKDGSTRLEEMFNVLPVKAQKAILATAFRDYDSPNSERMVDEIQNSVRAYYALSQDKMFVEAKNFKEARTAVESWKRQYQMDDVTGESYLPADNFSNFVLHLAAMYKGESQSFIQNTFGKIYDLIQGTQEETLFEQPDNTPRTLVQAIKEALNLDYNGQQRSNVLVGDTATSQRGQQGSNGTLAPRERVENGNGTTDDTGRTESIGGQSEIESSLSQEEMLSSDDTDNQLSAKIARRIEVQEDDWIESGKYGDTYKQTIIVDGTHKVIKVDAPDTKGNYIGSAYEYDGQTFGDLLDVLNYIDASLSLANAVAVAEKETDTTPTEKQKEAGNYKKGHVQVGTFNITIENPKGSVRSGIDTEGNKWETIMQNTYGYIRGTEGVDGDHIDVFLSDDIDGWNGRRVFVVDQYNEDGSFDEHKVMLGFNETDDAEAAYFANYDSDWAKKHKTVLTAVNLEDFEKWIDSSHRKTKAFAEYKSVKTKQEYKAFNDLLRDSDTAHPPYEGDVKMLLRLANKVLANGIKSIEYGLEEVTGSVSVNSSDKSKLDKYYYSNRNHTESGIDYSAYKGNISIVDEDNQTVYNFSYEPPQYKGKDAKLYVNVARIVGEEETTESIDTPYTITPAQYTTKRGKVLDMHLVKFNNELRDTVRKHTTMFAKQLKGWWDKEKQGFMMRSKEDAERLAEYATDAQSQPPLSLSDLSEVNDGNVQFSEPQQQKATKQEEKQEYTPIWQYSVFVDKETGETTLSRDDVSGPIPIGDARFRQTTNSPEEMLDILRNPQNGMQEVLDAVGISLENKIKTRELDRKAKDEIRDKRTDFVVDKEMDNRYSVRTLMKMIDAEKQAVMDLGEKRGGDVYHEGNIIFLTKDSADKFANEVRTLINDMRSEQQQDNSQKKTEASGNRLVTDERYAELRERMRKKLLGQMNIGIDPEILAIGTEMAVYHLEKGSRKFAEYATAMIADLGDAIRPYLKAFYNGARDLPEVSENGLDTDMTPYDEVQQFDVANFDKPDIDALATAETVIREKEVEQEVEIAQERIKKSRSTRKKSEKKAVNSQQSNELGLFDDLIDNNKNNEHGLQRTDAERSEGVSANGNRHGQGLSRGTETGSESEQQAGRGTDNEGERTSDAEIAALNAEIANDYRNGIGTYTDDEVSYENDPVAKLLGQSRRTAKQRREFARRERQRMAERVESLAEKLHLDNVEVVTDASVLDGKKQRAKGFYSKSTGKITIVIPNHTSTFDVEQTLLHEAVAHYGLRQLFGEHFDTFLDNVFNNADENIRRRIVDMAAKNGWNFHKATEEYLASLAEDTEFENINASWWQQIKDFFLNMLHKIGFEDFRGVTLSDNELRYILWRSYENLAEPGRYRNILGEAADVAKQYELKVGNYAVSDPHHQTVAESDDALYRTGAPEIHERELARDRYERRVKSGMFQSQEALQDSMLGLKEAMTAILGKETNIEDVDGFENAYLGENRLSSVNKAEADAFAHTLFKPMLDEVAKLARTEAEREELTDYMMAKHGLERNTYMRNEAINNGATDADQTDYAGLTALTGMDNVADAETEAQIMVNDYEQAHDTTDLWKKVNAASKAILSKSYECGMMSKATFDKISDMYDFYIPLRGFDEKTSSEAYAYLTHKQSAFNAPIKKAEGRRSKADDPFANLQSMAEGAIMQGNRNKLVKQRFLNFALNHSSDLVSVSDIWVEYDTVADEWKPVFPDNIDSTDTPEVVERKMLDFETKMESLAQQYPDRYKHGKDTVNIPYRIVESRDMRQHQIVVKRGGRDYVITINGNPRAAQALNGQTNPDNDMSGAIGAILRAGENINRQLSAFYTTRNPDFIVSNFMRDMLYTNTMTWIRESPNYALRFHRNYMYANPVRIKQLLAKHRKGTLDMSNKTEAMFHQFMMNGGETGYANIRDIEQHKNDIRRELKKSNGKIPVKKAWDLLGERFDEYNRAVENCARFAAFMTSREMGRSIDRAIYDAKEISVNFNKKGSGAKFYDSTGQTKAGNASALVSGLGRSGYVFWNAAIQGTANFGRQMKRHPAKAFTGIAAMFLLGAIVAYLGGDDDDDDDKNAYYNLPEYVRRSNILFRAGNSWVSIPLPVEYRAVYGMGELMISVLNGKEHLTGEEIAEAITGQATQILPIDFLEGGGGLNAFVPSAYKPLWEAYVAEKSWTGMPLYKDTPYNKDMPEWTKAYKSANKYIVGLANAMNEATGGDPYTKGTIDFNPAKIEYMLNGYFGGVFGTIDKLSKTAETITDNREYDPRSFLLVNRLVKAGDERTEYRAVNNEYFRLKEEHDRLKSRLKHYEEDTDNDIFDYAEKIDFLYNSPEYERYEIFEDYRRDIDDLYNELNDTVDDEERKNIEAELNELKKEMIEEMNKTRK